MVQTDASGGRSVQRTSAPTTVPDPNPLSHPALATLCRRLTWAKVQPFEVELEDGTVYRLAGGARPLESNDQARFRFVLRNRRGLNALASLEELEIASAYMQGDLDVDGDFLSCLDLREILSDRHPLLSLLRFTVPLLLGQRRSDAKWVPHHYDFGNEFYWAFLDKRYGLYSQALYKSESESLEQAVVNKLEYIAEICRLEPGSHVLDVGAGWGALEKFIAPRGIHSTMLTLSHEQYRFLSESFVTQQMSARLRVVQENIFAYDPPEQYDAIIILGVMEHLPDYRRLCKRLSRLLKPGGRVYMDFVACRQKYSVSSFTYRHVFPGNHTPVYLPGLFAAANESELEPIVLHNDRHSYHLTLQAWARNLEAAHDVVLPLVGEQTYRLFRLYLWGSAHQLRQSDGWLESYRVVFQRARGRPSAEIGCYEPV